MKTNLRPPSKEILYNNNEISKLNDRKLSNQNIKNEVENVQNNHSKNTPCNFYKQQNYQNKKKEFNEENQVNSQFSYSNFSHKTSQRHKTNKNDYKIDPSTIPRPNYKNEIYNGKDNTPTYKTDIGSQPPYSTSFYFVKETVNSSCRFVRPSFTFVPTSQALLNRINLLFTLSVQPFAEIPSYEKSIPKIEATEGIFRCKKCNSYINSNYKINYSNNGKLVAVCNLCNNENELNKIYPGAKDEYFNNDHSNLLELSCPTIDFILPGNNDIIFTPHYIFIIDISETSLGLNLPSYVLNSIQSNFDFFNNAENSYISFIFYDTKALYFYYLEKNDIKLNILKDIDEPFSPICIKNLFLNIASQKEELNKILEKLNSIISEKSENLEEVRTQQSTPTGAAIKAGIESLIGNGGRLMVFTPNHCTKGFGKCILHENKINIKNEDDSTGKLGELASKNNLFNELAELACDNSICVDLFIFGSNLIDLSTFSTISNLTGGQCEFYTNDKDPIILNSNYEKLHYDISRILTRPNYYGVKFMIRFSQGLDISEILGPFNKKLGEAFQLGGCDPDYNYLYNIRLETNFKPNINLFFQIACLFTDNYGKKYLRIFNTSVQTKEEVKDILNNSDIESMTKGIIMKEISLTYRANFDKVRKNLEDRIINSFRLYRIKVKGTSDPGQLFLPLSLRYLPLFLHSFIKKGILSKNHNSFSSNDIIYLTIKFMREPIYSTIKFLYPKFYRIDDIQKEQINKYDPQNNNLIENIGLLNEKYNIIQKPYLLRLSRDLIDFDCAYLIDNGVFINILIFDQIDSQFYTDLFKSDNWNDISDKEINFLNEENQSDLNIRIMNIISQLRNENSGHFQPVRLFFLDQNGIYKPEIETLLVEDKFNEETNYPDFLTMIHTSIQTNLNN